MDTDALVQGGTNTGGLSLVGAGPLTKTVAAKSSVGFTWTYSAVGNGTASSTTTEPTTQPKSPREKYSAFARLIAGRRQVAAMSAANSSKPTPMRFETLAA